MEYVENKRLCRMLVRANLLTMVFASLLIAPLAMAAATLFEHQLGPSAGGWLVALPVSFAVAVFAVTLDAGAQTASTLALSAAAHVPAQILFAAAFASVLADRGLLVGGAAGALTYVTCAVALAPLPDVVPILAAIPLLVLAPRLMPAGQPRRGASRSRASTAMICAAAAILVAAAILTTRLAGPVAAGAIAAFPDSQHDASDRRRRARREGGRRAGSRRADSQPPLLPDVLSGHRRGHPGGGTAGHRTCAHRLRRRRADHVASGAARTPRRHRRLSLPGDGSRGRRSITTTRIAP